MQEFKDKTTILVVDDSPDSLGMINMALDQAGMTVLVALNGLQAMNVLEQITPDIILMDAIMPVMDGFECASKIRKQLPLIPIIFMTGLSETEHIVKAFNSGGNDYIIKPIHPDELLVRIQQHTNSTRMLMEAQKVLDSIQQHVFCIDKQGHILWATPDAQALLSQYQEQSNDDLDKVNNQLSHWLPNGQAGYDLALPLHQQKLILKVHYFKQSGENEFLLKVQSPNIETDPATLEESLTITFREAEVLLWLAHGKTNKEIAEILEMSPRTVNKHLEQMYPKIGADNRTAAASIAIQTILGGRIGNPKTSC